MEAAQSSSTADRDRADRLEIAIEGKGAFHRFKDVLGRWPDELERCYVFSEERQRVRARAWLAAAGYCPAPPTEPGPSRETLARRPQGTRSAPLHNR